MTRERPASPIQTIQKNGAEASKRPDITTMIKRSSTFLFKIRFWIGLSLTLPTTALAFLVLQDLLHHPIEERAEGLERGLPYLSLLRIPVASPPAASPNGQSIEPPIIMCENDVRRGASHYNDVLIASPRPSRTAHAYSFVPQTGNPTTITWADNNSILFDHGQGDIERIAIGWCGIPIISEKVNRR